MMSFVRKHTVTAAFLLSFLMASAVFVPKMWANGGLFALTSDFTAQQIPFGMLMNEGVKSGALWNAGIDLGGNLLESFGFYNLGSPFFLVTLLFPAAAYPYLMGWLMILKFAVAGATAALYLKRRVKTPLAVLFGAVLYAFSGYAVIGIVFYHFLDVVALFPLMLWAFDALMEDGQRNRFAPACFVNLCANPVFFFGSACFTVLYWLFLYVFPAKREQRLKPLWRATGRALAEAAAGCMLAGVLLVPTVTGLLGNARATNTMSLRNGLIPSKVHILMRWMAVFLPPENMNAYSAVLTKAWGTWSLYLPLCGSCFAIAYAVTEKDGLARFLRVLAVFLAVPILGSVFTAFAAEEYGRWYYMPALMAALASAKVFESTERRGLRRACLISFAAIAAYVLATAVLGTRLGTPVLRPNRYALSVGIAVASLLCCLIFKTYGGHAGVRKGFFALTVLCAAALLAVETVRYSSDGREDFRWGARVTEPGYSAAKVALATEPGADLPRDVLPYRYCFDEGTGRYNVNFGMAHALPTTGSFISTAESGVFALYGALGKPRTIFSHTGPAGVTELLGGRYVVSAERPEDGTEAAELVTSVGQTFYRYENANALPLGTVYTEYITRSELAQVSKDDRAAVMLRALVVPDEAEATVRKTLAHCDDFTALGAADAADAAGSHTAGETLSFREEKDAFTCTVRADADAYAFFSVPHNRWWKATVNGNPAEILDICGLMAVPVTAGENEIAFEYDYAPLRCGIAMTAAGALLWAGTAAVTRRKDKRTKNDA
ncbi:MAG: YfhO family protein [Clostridia bacterium]|nr:YfhO family protein [Clostridia bacterium]